MIPSYVFQYQLHVIHNLKAITGAWSFQDGTTGGCRLPSYLRNPTFLLRVSERTQILMRLTCPENEPINVTLYKTSSNGKR